MHRRSDEDFARFCVALQKSGQEHILEHLEQLSASVPESESVEESTTLAVINPSEEECQPKTIVNTAANDPLKVKWQNEDVPVGQANQCEYHLSTLLTF